MEGEAPRVAPSRAKSAEAHSSEKPAGKKARTKTARTKMPLVALANSPDKNAALAGLERRKRKPAEVATLLAVDDALVASMGEGHPRGHATETSSATYPSNA